jgi:aspartyl/asparaginyl-tRNA synthetase
MKNYNDIQDVFKDPYFDTIVQLYGTIKHMRNYGKLMFIIIYDCTSSIQLIFRNKEILKDLKCGAIIKVNGILKKDKRAVNSIDLTVDEYKIIQSAPKSESESESDSSSDSDSMLI